MTVKELIEQLKEYSPKAEIMIQGDYKNICIKVNDIDAMDVKKEEDCDEYSWTQEDNPKKISAVILTN